MERSMTHPPFNARGFTLIELTIAVATIGMIVTATLTTVDSIRVEKGLAVGAELRTLHLAQKHYLIQSLDDPGSIDLSLLTIAHLQETGVSPHSFPAIEKTGMSTVQVNVMPPSCSLDGTKGDTPKLNKATGDHLYDIGPE
jgi:prepilin-type N-terminal cleavage/methylation domain-containing protein